MEETKCSRVKLESVLSVVSGKPTDPGKIHKLSLLDRAMGRHTIHIVFYYGSNPFLDGPMPSDLANLRVTLSELLDEYPYVTGRLTREPDGEWQIKFNDAGVRMLQATVDATLDEWLRSADAEEERDLTAWETMPHDPSFWSPFRVQINKFKCGGLALGLSCTHMHTDLTSATMLFKAWSEVHRRQPPTHPPIFDLPPPPPTPTPLSIPTPSSHSTTPPTKVATATFKFSAAAVDKCLSQAEPDATPFDVLAALFWSRTVQLQLQLQPPHHARTRSLSVCVDFRDQGVPYAYFGNALRFSTLTIDSGNLLSGGLGLVAGHVSRHVARMKNEEFSSAVEGMYGGAALTCVNAEHMIEAESGRGLMYDAEFKNGQRPLHVSYCVGNVAGEGLIMVMPEAEGGRGRTVTVTLPEEQVAELCKDQVILDLEPTMILCGKR